MKRIVLLSDSHHTIDERFSSHFLSADEIWHAGDIGSLNVIDTLEEYAPVKAVFGNIDDRILRSEYTEILCFECEKVKVMMTHIGGYPGRYNKKILPIIKKNKPDLFISGHSHILKIIYDKKYRLLFMNPGAIGDVGIHQVKTILCFNIENTEIKNLKVIEYARNKISESYQ